MRLRRALVVVAGVLVTLAASGGASAADVDCADVDLDSPAVLAESPSRPLQVLGVSRAQEIVAALGPRFWVGVAVIDSGVAQTKRISVVDRVSFAGQGPVRDYHGTAVAGLIAGRSGTRGPVIGVAPDAQIVDVRVYDEATPSDESSVGVETPRVVAGLRWVARHLSDYNIRVVNVSLEVPPSRALAAAVRALQREDVVIVAATGNRPAAGQPLAERFPQFQPGEDAADAVFPAGYPGVVGANAASADASYDVRNDVLQSSATDVAAPTAGAVSVARNGGTCVLPSVATSWSAAEVSGLVALLRMAYPGETAPQIVARLTETASGTPGVSTLLTGAGIVQPVAAVSRSLHPEVDGTLAQGESESIGATRATPPAPAANQLRELRRTTMWWGLLGGAVVVVALILRPLLGRRRDG